MINLISFKIRNANSKHAAADQVMVDRASITAARMAEEGKHRRNIRLWSRLISLG